MGLGLGAMAWLHHLLLRQFEMKRRTAWFTLLLGLPLAVIFSKLMFLAFRFDQFNNHGAAALIQLNPETFSFVGGCFGFVLGAVFAALISREKVLKALDVFAVPACLMVAVARAAEGFLGDLGIGDYVDAEAFQFFPLAVQDDWGGWALAVFMLAALAAAACGLFVSGKLELYRVPAGLVFERTVVGLGCGQMFFEILRVVYIQLSFVRTEQVLCALAVVIVLIRRCVLLRKRHGRRAWLLVGIAVILLFVLWQIFLQFALDKTDYLIDPLPLSETAMDWLKSNLMPVCLGLMGLGIVGLLVFDGLSVRAYWRAEVTEAISQKLLELQAQDEAAAAAKAEAEADTALQQKKKGKKKDKEKSKKKKGKKKDKKA